MKSGWGRRGARQPKQLGGGLRGTAGRLSVVMLVLLICTISLFSRIWHSSPSSPIQICNAVLEAHIMNATLVLPELDTNSFWHDKRCLDIFAIEELKILMKYRKENFAEKKLVYRERRISGKCPLTPEEVGLILRVMGFDNATRIYLAAGELFGGHCFMKPFNKALFGTAFLLFLKVAF